MSDVSAAPPARPVRELLPNLIWEAVLLLVAVGVTIGLYLQNSEVFGRGGAWSTMAFTGFAALGLALSLRTGTPNLAVGQLAALAGVIYAKQDSILLALLAVLGLGLAMALITGLTGLPGWVVTFSAGLVVQAILIGQATGGVIRLQDPGVPGSYVPWAVAFFVLSILGGVLFAVPAVRRLLSANRPAGGEAGAFSVAKLLGALVGITGSSVLAAVAGILQTRYISAAQPFDTGLLVDGLAAVLLGAVSPFGRRAGVFGVALGVVIVDFLWQWELLKGAGSWVMTLTAAICALVGLFAIWLIELIGRRVSPLVTAPAPVVPAPMPFAGYAVPAPVPNVPFAPPGAVPPQFAGPPPVSAPPQFAGPPPVSGPPQYAGPPVSGPPQFAGPPVSGPPVSPPAAPPAPGWPPPPPQ
ncbi:hypothetical protein GCM10022255_064210 [Dactylosporangium darangshiense]|uniref:Uncharacterized protein n=1 Tax=Dactylosporangium darangshiense TaxID=579108 RepID=A0ABP8DGH3_9ACTN